MAVGIVGQHDTQHLDPYVAQAAQRRDGRFGPGRARLNDKDRGIGDRRDQRSVSQTNDWRGIDDDVVKALGLLLKNNSQTRRAQQFSRVRRKLTGCHGEQVGVADLMIFDRVDTST